MTKSLYEWCVENNRTDILERWDYELNTIDPKSVRYMAKIPMYLKCPEGIHQSSKFLIDSLGKHDSPLECKCCTSFEHWCNINNRQDLLDRWDYELNYFTPLEVGKTSVRRYYFKCPRGIHESSTYKLVNLTKYSYSEAKCKKCNSFAQWGIDNYGDDFLDKYWDYELNKDISPWDIPFRARSTTTIYIKCQYDSNHKSYKTFPDHFVNGCRCPECAREKTESYFQEAIRLYIHSKYNTYLLTHEYDCSIVAYNKESKHYMPYDNDLRINDNIHLMIECHGKQHYEITQYTMLYAKRAGITPEEALNRQKDRDLKKKEYALSFPGYYYLELSYKAVQDESYKSLIDEKVQSILNNTKLLETPEKEAI